MNPQTTMNITVFLLCCTSVFYAWAWRITGSPVMAVFCIVALAVILWAYRLDRWYRANKYYDLDV